MRLLLDESLPNELAFEIIGHEVKTVTQMGWSSYSDKELLQVSADYFDILLTADQNLEYQQNLSKVNLGIIVLVAKNNRIQTLRPLISSILKKIPFVKKHRILRITD